MQNQPAQSLRAIHAQDSKNNIIESARDGELKEQHLLTDRDIRLALKKLGLNEKVHIALFETADIFAQLAFAHKDRGQDETPYDVYFIINKNDNHWPRLKVSIDPKNKKISAVYTDSLKLNVHEIGQIDAALKDALKFEDYKIDVTLIKGKNEQRDAWSCGYHALFGTVKELVKDKELEEKVILAGYSDFLALNSSRNDFAQQARDEVVQMVLDQAEQQAGNIENEKAAIEERKRHRQEENREEEAIYEVLPEFKDLLVQKEEKDEPTEFNLEIFKDKTDALKLLVSSIKVVERNKITLKITGIAELGASPEELRACLAQYPYFTQYEYNVSGDEQFDEQLNKDLARIVLRNKVIKAFNLRIDVDDHDFDKKIAEQMLSNDFGDNLVYFEIVKDEKEKDLLNQYVAGGDNPFFEKTLQVIVENPSLITHRSFIISFDVEKIQILNKYIKQLPFTEISISVSNEPKEKDQFLQELKVLIENLPSKLETLKLEIPKYNVFNAHNINEIIAIVKEKDITTSIILKSSENSPALTDLQSQLSNAAALNRRRHNQPEKKEPNPNLVPIRSLERRAQRNAKFLQVQVQRTQQQEVQQQLQSSKSKRPRPPKKMVGIPGLYGEIVSEELVDVNSILNNPYAAHYLFVNPNKNVDYLQMAWREFVGSQAEFLKFGIRYMTPAAAIQFANHTEHFNGGSNFHRLLPEGFFLQSTTNGEIVLNYDKSFSLTDLKPNPLRLKLTKKRLRPIYQGDVRQFDLEEDNPQSTFFGIQDKEISYKQAKEAIFRMMEAENPDVAKRIKETYVELQKGFDLHFLAELPGNFNGFRKSYILVGENLFYINDNAQKIELTSITMKKASKLRDFIDAQNRNRSKNKIHLSNEEVRDVLVEPMIHTPPIEGIYQFQSLWPVFYECGCQGVETLLTKLHKLADTDENLFYFFKSNFLDRSENWLEFMTPDALKALDELSELTKAQRNWWNQLIARHGKYRNWSDFPDLFESFKYFCAEYRRVAKKNDLPEKAFETMVLGNHMKVVMDQILFFLEKSSNKDEQEQEFLKKGFNFSNTGPFYAILFDDYHFISAGMEIGLADNILLQGDYQITNQRLRDEIDIIEDGKSILEAKFQKYKKLCFRYLGTQQIGAPYRTYESAFSDGQNSTMSCLENGCLGNFNKGDKISFCLMALYVISTSHSRSRNESFIDLVTDKARFLRAQLNNTCVFHLMSEFPKDLRGYKNNYILIGNNDLRYVNDDLTFVSVPITDSSQFSSFLETFKVGNELPKELRLTYELVQNYIRPNRPGTFLRNRQHLEKALIEVMSWETLKPRLNFSESLIIATLLFKANDFEKAAQKLKNLIILYKKPFLRVLKKYDLNSSPLSIDEYVNAVDIFSKTKEISSSMQIKLVSFFALINTEDKPPSHYKTKLGMLRFAMGELLNENNKHRLELLLDILVKINVRKSTTLPTIDQLQELFNLITDNEKYNQSQFLELLVKEKLPNCSFELDEISKEKRPKRHEPRVDSLNLAEILEQLKAELEDEKIQEDAENQSKPTEERLILLLRKVDEGEKSVWFRIKLEGGIYFAKNWLQDQIGLQVEKGELTDFNKLLKGTLFPQADSDQLEISLIRFFAYKNNVEPLLETLKLIRQKWPAQMDQIVQALSASDAGIKAGKPSPLEFLNKQLKEFLACYEDDFSFPVSLLKTVLATNVNPETFEVIKHFHIEHTKHRYSTISVANKENIIQIIKKIPDKANQELYFRNFTAAFDSITLNVLMTSLLNIYINIDFAKIEKIDGLLNHLTPFIPVRILQPFVALFESAKDSQYFYEIIDKLDQQDSITKKIQISTIIASLMKQVDYGSVNKIKALIDLLAAKDSKLLTRIVEMCKSFSDLTVDQIEDSLNSPNIETTLDLLQVKLDVAKKEKEKKQFDTSKAFDAISRIKDITYTDSESLSLFSSQQKRLYEDFLVVNGLGLTHPIMVRQSDDLENKYPAARDLSDGEIVSLLNNARYVLSDKSGFFTEDQKRQQRLIALALLREMMYRTHFKEKKDGKTEYIFPNSTQIIAVLNALEQGENANVLNEIKTGQGKSIITALLAAMLNLEGQTVDVCTANSDLAKRDLATFLTFFNKCGFQCSNKAIGIDSTQDEYKVGGINYSDAASLALFRAQMTIEGTLPKVDKVSLVMDEADHTILDDNIEYRAAVNLNPGSELQQNPYRWVYFAINQFIDEEFIDKNIEESKIKERLRVNLKEYLNNYSKGVTGTERKMLLDLPNIDKKLETWIDSAFAALEKKENVDFIIVKENGYHVAKLLDQYGRRTDATEGLGVQQFLHARLSAEKEKAKAKDQENNDYTFNIEPEESPLATATSKNFIDYYLKGYARILMVDKIPTQIKTGTIQLQMKDNQLTAYWNEEGKIVEKSLPESEVKYILDLIGNATESEDKSLIDKITAAYGCPRLNRGRIIGLTGTVGSQNERKEHRKKYGFKQFRIPPHAAKPRTDITYLADNETAREKLIVAEVLKRLNYKKHWWNLKRNTVAQPILIAAKDIDQAERILKILNDRLGNHPRLKALQLYTAKDAYRTKNGVKQEYKEKVESEVVRAAGIDGVVTISTLLDRGIDIDHGNHPRGLCTIQAQFASDRLTGQIKGRTGRMEDEADYVQIITRDELRGDLTRENNLTTMRKEMSKESKRERLFREKFGDIKNELFERFMMIHDSLGDSYPNLPANALPTILLKFKRKWCDYLQDLELKWNAILQTETANPLETRAKFVSRMNLCASKIMVEANDSWIKMIDEMNTQLFPLKSEIPKAKPFEDVLSESSDKKTDVSSDKVDSSIDKVSIQNSGAKKSSKTDLRREENKQAVRTFNPDSVHVDQVYLERGIQNAIGLENEKRDEYQSRATHDRLERIQDELCKHRELKFKKQSLSDENARVNATKIILRTLLNAINQTRIRNQSFELVKLMQLYNKMMDVVRCDPRLQKVAYEVHQDHYLNLANLAYQEPQNHSRVFANNTKAAIANQRYLQEFSVMMSTLITDNYFANLLKKENSEQTKKEEISEKEAQDADENIEKEAQKEEINEEKATNEGVNLQAVGIWKEGIRNDGRYKDESKQMYIRKLEHYQKKWFKSDDRNTNVDILIANLNGADHNKNPEELLRFINAARTNAIKSDVEANTSKLRTYTYFFQRDISQSRYLDLLEELHHQFITTLMPDQIDGCLKNELEEFKNILEIIQDLKLPNQIKGRLSFVGTCLNQFGDSSDNDKYNGMMSFYEYVKRNQKNIDKLPNKMLRHLIYKAAQRAKDIDLLMMQGNRIRNDRVKVAK